MNRLTWRSAAFLCAAAALVWLAAPGGAQPLPGKGPNIPVIAALLPYVGDENLQKELKLDADQVKKLLTHRQKRWDAAWETAPKDLDFEKESKATADEFKAVLKPEQLRRANQIAVQLLWTERSGFGGLGGLAGGLGGGPAFLGGVAAADPRRAPAYTLAQNPEIADALKLDDTQKKLVAGEGPGFARFGSSIYLSPEQTATAKGLLGPEYKGALQSQYDTRNAGGFGGGLRGAPQILTFTGSPDVQKELNLKEEQLRALADLRLKANRPPNFEEFQTTSPAARTKAADEARVEAENALAKILTPEQLKRLRQIERQTQSGPEPALFTGGGLAKELGVTEGQLKKFDAAQADYADAVARALLSGQPFEKVNEAFAAAGRDRDKVIESLLTPDQQAKRKELIGEPFRGNPYAGGFQGLGATQRKLSFGRYSNQLTTLVQFKGVQEELKLKEEQVKKLGELNTEYQTKFPPQQMFQVLQDEKAAEKLFADRSAFIEKALADVLTKDQQARFRELNIQRLEAGRAGGGPLARNTAAAYPGVAEAIKLSAEQKAKILGGASAAGVLTDEQKKQIKDMLGKPADLAQVFALPDGPGGQRGPALRPAHQLMLNTLAWDALKLDRDQSAKVAAAANEYLLVAGPRRGGFGPGPGGGFPGGAPADPKEQAAAVERFAKAVDAALKPEQRKRLDQLAIQQSLANGLDESLLRTGTAEPAKSLTLTDEQRKIIADAAADTTRTAGLLDRTNIAWEKELDIRRKLRDQLDARVLKVLTGDQRAKLKELTGEPFEGFPKQPLFRGFGGPGGFGGLGGFGGPFGP